jgi:ABC-type transport system substrate-binding protein
MNVSSKKTFATLLLLTIFIVSIAAIPNIAYSATVYGPRFDKIRFLVVKSPDAVRLALLLNEIDFAPGLIRPSDVEDFAAAGKQVQSRPGFHFGHFGFNLRKPVLNDVNFRHAVACCMPKDELIGTIYKYIVTKIDAMAPPALGGWSGEGRVTAHPFNPGDPLASTVWNPATGDNKDACSVLRYGNYTYYGSGAGDRNAYWTDPNGDPLPEIHCFSPTYEVAPTSAEATARFIEECNNIGLNNMIHEPYEFWPYIVKVYQLQDFDMYLIFWGLSPQPDYLYGMVHSSQDVTWGDNCVGLNSPEMDALADTLYYSLDHEAKVAACHDLQALIADPTYEWGIPYICFYSRTYFDSFQPEVAGLVNMKGYCTDNAWSLDWGYWDTLDGYRPGTSENLFIYQNGEEPENMNPAYANTVYAWNIMGMIIESAHRYNPYTLATEPNVASSWTIESVPEGTKITWNFRDDIYWHDGTHFTAEDAVFAWNYLKDNEIVQWFSAWEHLINATQTGTYTAVTYLDVTSQWLFYRLSSVCAMFPKHIWETVTDDPLTPENEILLYQPWNVVNSLDADMTNLQGTGTYWLKYGEHDPLVATDLRANRAYWKSQDEFDSQRISMFHQCGDCAPPSSAYPIPQPTGYPWDGKVDANDLGKVGSWALKPSMDADADVCGPYGGPPDGICDLDDVTTCSVNVGEKRTTEIP